MFVIEIQLKTADLSQKGKKIRPSQVWFLSNKKVSCVLAA